MPVELNGETREVALAETQAVLAHAQSEERRSLLSDLLSQLEAGSLEEDDAAELLESVLELALQAGRVRAVYGPGGEQSALALLRRLPRGRERVASARAVSEALHALAGRRLEGVRITAVAPGAFTVTVDAEGVEASVRLDVAGARLTSVGT